MPKLISKIEETLQVLRSLEQVSEAERIQSMAETRERLEELLGEIHSVLATLNAKERKTISDYLKHLYDAAMTAGAIAKTVELIQKLL